MLALLYRRWPIATFSVLLLFQGCAQQEAEHPLTIDLRLMQTADVHAYVLGYDYFQQAATADYGLAHTAVLIEQARIENPNNLLIDNGDLIQGSAMGDWAASQGTPYLEEQVHPVIRALNYLEYDVGNLGNHEFNFGLDFMLETLKGADFPYVSANLFHAENEAVSGKQTEGWEAPIADPYLIQEHQFIASDGHQYQLKVGFIGFLPPQIMRWDQQHLAGKVMVRDIVESARHYIPQMQAEGADVIIAVPHSGLQTFNEYPLFAEQASLQLAEVEGIDAILFGHQHRLFPGDAAYQDLPGVDNSGGYVHGIPAVQPGYWGNHLGLIDLKLEQQEGQWQIVSSQVELRRITEQYDAELVRLLQTEQEATLEQLNTSMAEIEQDISNFFARVRPDKSIHLINQAQLWFARQLHEQGELDIELPLLSAAAPFRNGFQGPEDYTHIAAGSVTRGNLADLYVYPNTIQIVRLNGEQLRDWLEMSATAFARLDEETQGLQFILNPDFASYNFDMLSGVQYRIDISQPPRFDAQGQLLDENSHRITELSYQGREVSVEDEFLVVTNNYRAGGGGSFPHLDGSTLTYAADAEVRQVIADYILQLSSATPVPLDVPDNWQLELPDGVSGLFRSAGTQAAQEAALKEPRIDFVERNEAGFAIFRFN